MRYNKVEQKCIKFNNGNLFDKLLSPYSPLRMRKKRQMTIDDFAKCNFLIDQQEMFVDVISILLERHDKQFLIKFKLVKLPHRGMKSFLKSLSLNK